MLSSWRLFILGSLLIVIEVLIQCRIVHIYYTPTIFGQLSLVLLFLNMSLKNEDKK